MRHEILAEILKHTEKAPGIFSLEALAPAIARDASPGQFCMLETGETSSMDPLLKRPFSVHRVLEKGRIVFLYRVVGKGTGLLSGKRPGEKLRILGPLGNGFRWNDQTDSILIGGGLGIAPLLFLAESMHKTRPAHIILGARTKEEIQNLEEFRQAAHTLRLATEDGSMGIRGMVTDCLVQAMSAPGLPGPVTLYACGPSPMLRAVTSISAEKGIACQVSLETCMACGIGLCLGCAVKKAGEKGYFHVCRDGPVFDAAKIAL